MRTRERGMTLAEVLVSLAVVSVIIVFSGRVLSVAYRSIQINQNKQFATQKALSMLEELKALVQSEGDGSNGSVLDAYDDGTTNQTILTTQAGVTKPDAPVSGNTLLGGGQWLFERRITVEKVPGANDLRLVHVAVYVNDAGGTRVIAEVASVLSTIGQNSPPTQVYDIYLIAVENVPGWWVYMENVVPFVESAMLDLESRHAGLKFRRHWIRKLSYGRDPYYTPFVNGAADSTAPINSVYFYPGLLPSGSPVDNYYPPDFFNGRISVDGTVTNGADATNPLPYALADQYNNSLRYQDELNLFNARVSARLESATEPTLRLLLDDMYMHPANYTNAILINLHGELLPFPPVRNYSDPAKDPATYPNVRTVVHPERLRYKNTDIVNLRVYAYHTNIANPGAVPDWLGKGGVATPITVVLKGVNWTPQPSDITAITGGVDFDGDGSADPYASGNGSNAAAPVSAPTRMWWSSQVAGGDTIIRLYNTPLKTACVKVTNPCDRGGLDDSKRLYNLQYIPSPVEDLPDPASSQPFTTDLTTAGTGPKNTARWVIRIPTFALPSNKVLVFETRLGDDFTAGISSPPADSQSNLSRTYAYRGDDPWVFGDATHDPNLPLTERFQIIGDPRHCPYADLKMPHGSSGLVRADPLGMGYNRYFDDFHDAGGNRRADWPGWSYAAPFLSANWYGIKNNTADNTNNNDGWNTGAGMLEIDVPRMFQMLRSSLLRTHALYTTMTGFSYYYAGIGNEIGYDDANGFANSIPLSEKPFTGGAGTRYEQSITNAVINTIPGGVKVIKENGTNWWGMSWLGELYPDTAYATWKATGNLPTGTANGTFLRSLRENITTNLPSGTTFNPAVRRTQEKGSTTFFWTGSAGSTFHHVYADNTNGTLDTDGTVIANTYKFPLSATISNNRPFDIDINDTSMNPDHFLQPPYGQPTTLQTEARFYKHQSNIQGSSLLSMHDENKDTAFVVVNGLSPTGQSGVAFIARWSFLSLVQSFMNAGLTKVGGVTDPARIRELPRVVIATPNDSIDLNDPASVSITWNLEWKRWDGIAYTPSYPANFKEDASVKFALLYSRDNGKTWRYIQDESAATPGVWPADPLLMTASAYTWNVPAGSFPKGNYVIRVEAYRDGIPLHYAFHQYRAFIKR
jgi:prepilin-type N-terminal cleavage/methylation domain-containing protein